MKDALRTSSAQLRITAGMPRSTMQKLSRSSACLSIRRNMESTSDGRILVDSQLCIKCDRMDVSARADLPLKSKTLKDKRNLCARRLNLLLKLRVNEKEYNLSRILRS